jgi:hypothetical protein
MARRSVTDDLYDPRKGGQAIRIQSRRAMTTVLRAISEQPSGKGPP